MILLQLLMQVKEGELFRIGQYGGNEKKNCRTLPLVLRSTEENACQKAELISSIPGSLIPANYAASHRAA